ncbi:hypothetical protein JHS3_13120 [Jeongeupia sp. HS-3]|uniref:DUF2185 domain-containing protein n=1 Tax=Jeongeupia sp. HS-3 TaxID=1009682 RepID=UPI0018A47A95|nr:DUF2185 domain-containing protein [Jeongeupia sp. HS-3]BCL75576.1 hypothetical protein JHS3_13120 [Jeongeupia sp. HS-3]
MQKQFKLDKTQIQELATGHGLCVVSDMITVEGYPVGFMYREEPEDDADSGWRFLSGFESDTYIDNSKNFAVIDVNIVANYDAAIIPLLGSPVGAEFDKAEDGVTFLDANED